MSIADNEVLKSNLQVAMEESFPDFKYEYDKKLIENYTDMKISREQFDAYSSGDDGFTVREVMGSDETISRLYRGLGIHMQQSEVNIMCSILNILSEKTDIVFDLDDEENKPLLDRMVNGARTLLCQDYFPTVPMAYKENLSLIEAVTQVRKDLNLKPLENVI